MAAGIAVTQSLEYKFHCPKSRKIYTTWPSEEYQSTVQRWFQPTFFFFPIFVCTVQHVPPCTTGLPGKSWFTFKNYLFIYLWLLWIFVAVWSLSLVAMRGASHCGGFSYCGPQALGRLDVRICGAWAWLPCSTWNLPRPEIKLVSPTLGGRFSTTGPPGQSPHF